MSYFHFAHKTVHTEIVCSQSERQLRSSLENLEDSLEVCTAFASDSLNIYIRIIVEDFFIT